MAYVEVVEVNGVTMAEHSRVSEILGTEAVSGLHAVAAGATPGGMAIVSIWESKADCDTFKAQRLGPALAQAQAGGTPSLLLQLDGADVTLSEGARA